jgi:hypothetical protein
MTESNNNVWDDLGTISPGSDWDLFDSLAIASETFRITTTILNQQDWDNLKIKSGAWIRFYYMNSVSENYWIRVEPQFPTIREFPIPNQLKAQGQIVRYVGCKLSSPWVNVYGIEVFARWNLKIECLL